MSESLRETLTAWLDSDNPVKRTHARHRLAAMGPPQPGEYPSLARQAVNAGKAAVGFVASGFAMATEQQQAERLKICREPCEFYDAARGRCTHGKCGCFVAIKVKALAQVCPISKW